MSEQSYLSEAKAAIRDKNRDKAWKLLHKHINQTPTDVEAWLMLGGLAEASSSLTYLRNAERLAPNDPRVQQAVAWAKTRVKQDPVETQSPEFKVQPQKIENTQPVGLQADPGLSGGMDSIDERLQKDAKKQRAFTPKSESKAKTWFKYAGIAVFVAIMVFLLTIGVTSLITGNEPQVFGHRIMIVTSGSMEPTFDTGSIILVDVSDKQSHRVGSVVMFWTAEDPDKNITHRIIDTSVENGETIYKTKGDNNAAPDQVFITADNIIGGYTGITVPYLGYFFSFIKSRKGILLITMAFGLYLVITQVFRIKSLLAQSEET